MHGYVHVLLNAGDFHFLWECLRVLYMILWGTPAQPGSLCNLRELLNRKQVDKAVKVFSTGDEFLLHCFKAHLKARICTFFKLALLMIKLYTTAHVSGFTTRL